MSQIRTDLAMESFENSDQAAIPGVQVSRWETDGIEITEVLVTDNGAAEQLGKPKGSYLTLESPLLLERDPDARLAMAGLLAEEIDRMLPGGDGSAPVLVQYNGARHPLICSVKINSVFQWEPEEEWAFPYASVRIPVDQDALPAEAPVFDGPVSKECVMRAFF